MTQPNIVLIVADILGWGEFGRYGGDALRGAPTLPHVACAIAAVIRQPADKRASAVG